VIIEGDCAEVIKTLKESSVDLVITSPPYDNLRQYDSLPFEKFQMVARALECVIKPGGVIVWVVADATIDGSETGTSFRHALFFKEIGLNLHDTMIYKSEKPPLSHNRYEQKFEYMFVLSKGPPKTFNGLQDRSLYAGKVSSMTFRADGDKLSPGNKPGAVNDLKLRGNVWTYKTGKYLSTMDDEAFEHPAIFPETLVKDHMRSWSNPGDLVLDPFLGSGTTGKCAHELGREFIGIEISKQYVDLAKRRIEKTENQIAMFYE